MKLPSILELVDKALEESEAASSASDAVQDLQLRLEQIRDLVKSSSYEPRTTQIQRAELLKAVREETTGTGHQLLRDVLIDLDAAETRLETLLLTPRQRAVKRLKSLAGTFRTKSELKLPPKDLAYSILSERSEQIKGGES